LGVKILSMPSFGREVKPFAPCHRFAARKRTLWLNGSWVTGKICWPFLSRFPPSLVGVPRSRSMEHLCSWRRELRAVYRGPVECRPRCIWGYPAANLSTSIKVFIH
jgi:hypothetical protein